ncbi:MAG TPA: hypothetical protein VF244_10945 [Acidimicrobiales bacterium]
MIAVVDEETFDRLRPTVYASADRLAADPLMAETMERNGWTGEMLALGLILRFAADEGVEVE